MPRLGATNNEYAQQLGDLLDKTPKTVLAAVAVSLLSGGGDLLTDPEFDARRALIEEWAALHNAGVVPQRPPR